MLNKNTAPYFDTFDADNKFYQVLFRPQFAIQTRELNELQSILQNQIAQFGNHVFKEGSMVIPGQISVDTNYSYVKIDSTYNGSSVVGYLQSLINSNVILTGQTSGVAAKIINYVEATDTDELTIYVKYTSSGTDGTSSVFSAGEDLFTDETTPRGMTVINSTDCVGYGCAVNIQKGVYFVRNRFVAVAAQTLIVTKYVSNPTVNVGLRITDSFITPEETESLLDNAQGSSNYAAPGAHRYYMDLIISVDDGSTDFINLISINDGKVTSVVDSSSYSILEDTLARRTYDESGNYTVVPLNIQVKEHRNNDRGIWAANTDYLKGDVLEYNGNFYTVDKAGRTGITPPTHTTGVVANGGCTLIYSPVPDYNGGVYASGDQAKVAIGIDPGKAYVLGYEITNQNTKYIDDDKALTYDSTRNGIVPVSIGSYVNITNVFGALDVTSYPLVELYDRFVTTPGTAAGTKIGTARARYIEYDSGTIGSNASYILSLVDVSLNSGKSFEGNVRSIFFNNASGAEFTANIQQEVSRATGSISVSVSSTAVTGIGTNFLSEFNPGDAILFYSGTTPYTKIIASIASDTSLTITENAGVTVSGALLYKALSRLYESTKSGLIMKIPHSYVRKLRSIDNEAISNAAYYARDYFSATVVGGQIIINTASATETFASPQQPDAFYVVNATTGLIIAPISITLNTGSTAATIVVDAGLNGNILAVVATIRKTLKEKTKTAVKYFTEDFITQASAQAAIINLSKVDGIKLRKVSKFVSGGSPVAFGSAIPGSATEVDITSEYTFNNGQTDAFYANAKIVRNSGSIIPDSPIRVTYDYFERSASGDYYTVDSYGSETAPSYTSPDGTVYELRDSVDFRPDKVSASFTANLVPAIGYDFSSDYTYYLPRVDKVYLLGDGTFGVSKGVPSLNPNAPDIPKNSMLLATLYFSPKTETVSTSSVGVVQEDNRRYTMQDIGSIDRRLKNVEYYTSLSLLEQQTYNLQLFDSAGNLNFKNGFIVDPFTGQNIADTDSSDFKCSIDMSDPSMRPSFSSENIEFFETAQSDSDRLNKHYANNAGIVTLPFTEVSEITQPVASRIESIVPFLQFGFLGAVDLTPNTDTWYETTYAPAVVINQEGNYNALVKQFNLNVGTVWGIWSRIFRQNTNTPFNRQSFSNGNGTTTTVTTTIAASYSTQETSDVAIDVSVLPYIRSRNILFKGYGMRPMTNMYAFFDITDVTKYCTPASVMTVTNKSGLFDTTTVAGADANAAYRNLSNSNGTTAVSVGDVIHNGAGGDINSATATAVVVIDEGGTLQVVCVKGTFVSGQTVYGSISGVTATFYSLTTPTTIKSNAFGETAGIFQIPSSTNIRFSAGQRKFTLTSSETNALNANSVASGTYTATGYLTTRQKTIVSTRNGIISRSSVTTVDQPVQTNTGGGGGDPLAQSFYVSNKNGMFVTSVDVYFAAKDKTSTMWFEIVEMETGLPTKNVVPGSRIILRPDQVNISNDSTVATRIKMEYPVYLSGETEYAFVMGSDAPSYMVWVSHLGEYDIVTGRLISKQPSLGSMFKSQNATTWNPSQLDDIKFVINRANFDVSTAGNVTMESKDLDVISLETDPFFINAGSTKVRVFEPNHGLIVGSKVTISGSVDVGNIPASEINTQHTVESAELDSYIISVTTASTLNGYYGGSNVVASRDVRLDVAMAFSTHLTFDGTSVGYYITPTALGYLPQAEAIEVQPYANVSMPTAMVVASAENETAFIGGSSSLVSTIQIQSNNSYISPVVDLHRYSLAAIGNRIDNQTTAKNISILDSVSLGSSTSIGFSGSNVTSATSNSVFLKVKPGCYVTISGSANSGNNGTFLAKEVDPNGLYVTFANKTFTTEAAGATVTFVLANRFVDEIAPIGGTSEAKYIIKKMTLDLPANQLSVYFDVSKPDSTEVDMYYRLSNTGSDITSKYWTKLEPSVPIARSDNPTVFNSAQYKLDSVTEFDTAQIKLVLRSDDTAIVPIVKNLRMIAMS